MNLNNLNMNTLVSMVNVLGGSATNKTFNARSKAVARINKLAAEQNLILSNVFDADGAKLVVKAEVVEKKISIRSVAESLLLKVVTNDEKGVIGLAYDEVLSTIKNQFPAAKTTVGCLRWYAAHMREANQVLPVRPRAKHA